MIYKAKINKKQQKFKQKFIKEANDFFESNIKENLKNLQLVYNELAKDLIKLQKYTHNKKYIKANKIFELIISDYLTALKLSNHRDKIANYHLKDRLNNKSVKIYNNNSHHYNNEEQKFIDDFLTYINLYYTHTFILCLSALQQDYDNFVEDVMIAQNEIIEKSFDKYLLSTFIIDYLARVKLDNKCYETSKFIKPKTVYSYLIDLVIMINEDD